MNKLIIFQSLMSDTKFIISSSEESIVRNAMLKESWIVSTPKEKQIRRKQFLSSGKKIKSVINLIYYEKMISIYDMILEILSKLEKIFTDKENKGEIVEIPLLRIAALFLIEKDFVDEYILPYHHAYPFYFQNISKEFHSEYPDLNLNEFAEKYTEMYNLWPEKSKYEIKKP